MRTIEFARDGARIVVLNPGGLASVDLAGRSPIPLAASDVHAFACVVDEIWVVAGRPAVLTVYETDGAVVGSIAVPGPGARPRLLPATGTRRAAWHGAQVALIARSDDLVVAQVDCEFALPLSSTRTIVANHHRLALREQDAIRWTVALPYGGTISDGTLVLDGKAVAIVGATIASQTITVVGLRDGAILHRITIGIGDRVRIAATRSVALVHTAAGHLVVIDLRFGRVIVDYAEPRPIVEATIDDSGQQIALRLADDPASVAQVSLADLSTAAASVPPPIAAPEPLPPSIELPTNSQPVDAIAVDPRRRGSTDPFASSGLVLACPALPSRPAIEGTSPEQTVALQARNRDLVIATTSSAIARAWDEGRLAYQQSQDFPFASEVSGVSAGQRGLAIDELAGTRQRLEAVTRSALEARRAVAPRLGPLDALATELELSPIARDLVLLIAAPSLWGEIARLYGILANDEGRPLIDEHLLSELLVDHADRAQIARELDDDGPLVRYGLIHIQPGAMRPFLPLLVEPVVLKLLRGTPVETELAPMIRTVAATRTLDELRIPTIVKRKLVDDLARANAPLRIVIRGRVGSGRHTVLAGIAAASRHDLGVIDATGIFRDAQARIGELAVALNRARLAGLLPCIDGLESIASQDLVIRDRVREIVRLHAGPLAVRLPWEREIGPPLDPGYVLIDLPPLTLSDRLVCWERSLAHHQISVGEVGDLADRYAIGPGVVERVVAEVANAGDRAADSGPRVEASIRQHLETRIGSTANRVTRLASWEQIIVPVDIQDSLTELIARIKHRRIVFDVWGFDRLMSTSRGVTALFQGGPGTGKTLVASAIANELGMDLYRVDLSRVMSKWIGETEQNLAKLFDAAEDGNTIILFDEADSLFAKRTEVKSSVDRYANLEVNYLLQRIDSFEGIAILTTNFGASIDHAFKRRLSLRLTFPFPDEDMREKLWRAHLPPAIPTAGAFDLAEIARRYRMSGGYIRNAVLRAAFLAAEEHGPLTQSHIERAIKAEFREIGKLADSGMLE